MIDFFARPSTLSRLFIFIALCNLLYFHMVLALVSKIPDLTLCNFELRSDRKALKTPTRSGKRPRSLLLQKVDEDVQARSGSFLARPRAGSRSISSPRARARSISSPRAGSRSISSPSAGSRSRSMSSPRARSRSISSLEERMLVEEKLELEEERRRFLLRKRKQEESRR